MSRKQGNSPSRNKHHGYLAINLVSHRVSMGRAPKQCHFRNPVLIRNRINQKCHAAMASPKMPSDPNILPSGELTFCHGKSPFLMGKSTISMAIFNCFLLVHQRVAPGCPDSPNPPKAPLNPKLPFAARCAGREDLVHRSRGTGGHGEVLQRRSSPFSPVK